ncbi:uncharacterized protein EAF02_003344 [Botrytis sinoallii]|uniref:uncharacterized protein n=1 Tax=Botrytis sinoallii TaxID=1463999 RepID=UPI0019029DD2|nr:uncharacterized protein EAF02_003344 [Botrytis sinoallii]KAF7886697.1 hypothetical protein EAF02_003344 [Botrytis sinoallii]
MSLIPSSKHKSKRGSSDHNKSSSTSDAGSANLLTTYPEFDQLVKDLKQFDLSLDSKYNHGNTGLKAHESNFREAMKDLQKASKALADKLEEISKLTARKKRRMDRLDSLKNGCGAGVDDAEKAWNKWLEKQNEEEENEKKQKRRAEEARRGAQIRSHPEKKPYKGHWSKWSHQDEYFLQKYGTKGFKPEDMLLGDNGLQGQLKTSLENIKWHENPKMIWS